MARCIFENLTPEQVQCFAEWFEDQGVQDCRMWFEEDCIGPPMTDMKHKPRWLEKLNNGDCIVYCR